MKSEKWPMLADVKLTRGKVIVAGLVLLGLTFLTLGVMMTKKRPNYYAHSLRNWQEADAVPGYPIALNGEVELREFVTMEFAPNLNLLSGIDLYLLPVARAFENPLGDFAIIEEGFGANGLLGAKLNSAGGGTAGVSDSVLAAGNGLVLFVGQAEGYPGKVIVLGHRLPDGKVVQSLYARVSDVSVRVGKVVSRGAEMAKLISLEKEVGLHFEIRESIGIDVMRQEIAGVVLNELRSANHFNRIDPMAFLEEHEVASCWAEPLAVMQEAKGKNFSEILEMDAESAAKLSEILGGEEKE
ncbi:M23 family metallopeptidase [Akkermansiaceae bacterium]|nr:M23 family metallopeptidase [Akkermansiaceae bacterium]MDB4459453.1 M23 family metallopeptidase [bacterium]